MEGPGFDPDVVGMIPRSVLQVFESSKALEEKGWKYTFTVQFLEIYNETIRDLLTSPTSTDSKKHEIKHVNGKTSVTDVQNIIVTSPSELFKILKSASENRAVASTNCNERSSRSHSIFTLKMEGLNSITNERLDGMLNLIDLAGSERLSISGSTGDRLKETQAINKSLSALGDVIYALGQKDAFVPYRNSKVCYYNRMFYIFS
jgi:kinesin family protein C1